MTRIDGYDKWKLKTPKEYEPDERRRYPMDFTLKLNCDNAAFDEQPEETVADLLRQVAGRVAWGEPAGKIRDINGNTVGEFEFQFD